MVRLGESVGYNFQCWGVLLIWIAVGLGPTMLVVIVWTFFLLPITAFFSPSLGARLLNVD